MKTVAIFFIFCCIAVLLVEGRQKGRRKGGNGKSRGGMKVKVDAHGNMLTRQIELMFRQHNYELSLRPTGKGDRPTHVELALMIESITDISEKNMDLTFTLCMHETWQDRRLQFVGENSNQSVVLPSRLIDKLWVPDLYIVGSKSSFTHKTTVDNVVLRIFTDGTILYSLKITTTVACQMSLYNFPLDMENCTLSFQSLGYSSNELTLHWSSREDSQNLFMDERLVKNMPKFQLLHHQFHSWNVSMLAMDGFVPMTRCSLSVSFELKRYLLSVFFQSYFPAMAMVLLAGLGMWVDPKSVPARVALGVTSVLTISTIIAGLKSSLPKVSYLTAMDIYLWACFLFVFSTVLEYCVLNYMMTQAGSEKSQVASTAMSLRSCWYRTARRDPSSLDGYFRVGYLITFLVFNVAYWSYYVIATQHELVSTE
uniref:gamma-aminobutyric acid receptor subunit rho-2 n=1 Tax=Ciona intestinalis TaxID=7719 RepID=UPI0000524193|nr:gamma-aminobutyric acid receptor subunit rho-2 [Ciona intestinalis]|eukprot:XP_002127661.1 gamma-aminobutyric acid receptor subunit rho-2 [Ciona intestinalis]